MFVDPKKREAVSDDQGNTIWIRPKMDFATRAKVHNELIRVMPRPGTKNGEALTDLQVGAGQVALLKHNILGWEGPAFAGFACIPKNIERLDPDEPLVVKVLERLNEANNPKPLPVEPGEQDDDPNDSGAAG